MLTRRARRRGEQGQVLIMALAFVVFFALVTTAVLQLADAVELRQAHTQSATSSDAAAEGGMFLAAQAAEQAGADCVVGTQATLSMTTTGASASYRTTACNPGTTADLLADQCAVCVVGNKPSTVDGVLGPVQGPVVFNRGVTGSGSVSSDPGVVACGPLSSCSAAHISPSPPATLGGTVSPDAPRLPSPPPQYECRPLADDDGTFSNPLGGGPCFVADPGTAAIEWDGSVTPHHYLSANSTLIFEYPLNITNTTVSVEDGGTATLDFLNGASLTIGDGGALDGDMTLEFGTGGLGTDLCSTDATICIGTGGSLDVTGGVFATGGASAAGMEVQAGATADVSGSAMTGTGNALVIGSLTIDAGRGRQPAGTVQVEASPPTGGYCWVYKDDVLDSAGKVIGGVVVEAACAGGTTAGIISINYGS
jgi:hypothetical protein